MASETYYQSHVLSSNREFLVRLSQMTISAFFKSSRCAQDATADLSENMSMPRGCLKEYVMEWDGNMRLITATIKVN
jgi:hypothetical protein